MGATDKARRAAAGMAVPAERDTMTEGAALPAG